MAGTLKSRYGNIAENDILEKFRRVNVYIETYGCRYNFGDTAKLVEILKHKGCTVVNSAEEADAVIINTCTVVGQTERRMLRRLSHFRDCNLFADVTEKGLLLREISKSRDLSTIGMLARWMAHEIRNPLSSLNINIELLREELGGDTHLSQKDEIHSLINFISYETLRLENNLKEFLDFNRLPPLKFEWIQLNELLDSVVRLSRPDAQIKNARIETHFQKKLPVLKIDVSQFNLAISNLLINSIQAVSEKGVIHLFTRGSRKNVFIIIQDNGVGISQEHLPKIFDFMFSTKPTGSGLGLSIAKKIISDHHGEISVKSEVNKGSVFRIRIPLGQKT